MHRLSVGYKPIGQHLLFIYKIRHIIIANVHHMSEKCDTAAHELGKEETLSSKMSEFGWLIYV